MLLLDFLHEAERSTKYFHPLSSLRLLLGIFTLVALSGCLSPMALNRAVIEYDAAVTSATSKQLLINIARAHHHEPVHFTGVSNIAATFSFSASAGATPAPGGLAGQALAPIFGGSVTENPTISIVPIEGEEFAKRLFTPFQQNKLALLLRQRIDIDLLLRMMAQEMRLQSHGPGRAHHGVENLGEEERRRHQHQHQGEQVVPRDSLSPEERQHRLRLRRHGQPVSYRNTPSDTAGYEMFRRVALHLSAIQDQNQLYVEPMVFQRSWTIPASAVSAEGFQALEKEFVVLYNQPDNTYVLNKQVPGPILITNYDPDILCCEERALLNDLARTWNENDVAFDIRPDYPGGEWPMRGAFRLRSFHAILNFIGRSIDTEPEYHVEKDPRTPPIIRDENPVSTMELIVSDSPIPKASLSVHSHDRYYAVNTTGSLGQWNRDAFQLLFVLFQMTMIEMPRPGVPSITIAK